jgi:hypothetical protein
MLQSGDVDIVSLGTSADLESRFLPVRIDILRGLLGYRVFLIRAARQAEFSAVKTLDDLRRFTAGFGAQWGDFPILRENRLGVEGLADAGSIIPMLVAGRVDYFPRGINEAWVELNANRAKYPGLAVEQDLALFYPFPVYFFVKKGNTLLADRIGRGLKLALADGSFRNLFLQYHRNMIEVAKLSGRRVFRLTNTTLPEGTPDIDTSWWLTEKR